MTGRRALRARLAWAIAIVLGLALGAAVVAAAGPGPGAVTLVAIAIAAIRYRVAPWLLARLWRQLRWRVFLVPHTHWDREWYERFAGFRARLVPMVAELLDLLEREPRMRSFTFDGQTIPLEDHLDVRPEDRARVEALVRADRLLVGPHYVLADLLLVRGESLLRNLEEGLRVSGSFGRASRVAYVADPFGHPAQMPQILRGFGYTAYVFSRGVGDEGERLGDTFQWEAPSGDRVRACHLVDHYSSGSPLVGPPDEDERALSRRVRTALPRLLDRAIRYADGDALVLMVGDDHTRPYAGLPQAIDALRGAGLALDARVASLEEYVDALPPARGVHAGEMVAGRYRKILRGVNATRVWIKQENAACERLLLERCEPLDALAGGGEREELRALWRTLLANQAHDSICGCSADLVHDVDMRARFAAVRAGGDALFGRLARRLSGEGDAAMVWSSLPWERDAVVELAGAPMRVRTAALGAAPLDRSPADPVTASGEGVIENGALRVEVAEDGTFVVIDRLTGSRSGRMNLLVDEGDRGDLYTHSYAGPTVDSRDLRGTRTTTARGDRATVEVRLEWPLPVSLRDDRLARAPETVRCSLRTAISLDSGADVVRVRTTFDNRALDHRLRAHFETGTRALTHVAGAAFAWLERPTRIGLGRGWAEPPTPDRCFHELVAVEGATRGLAVGADGLRDYAVLADGATIALTLFRAIGWLSRDDLPERPGHAGPELATPSAQSVGERAYDYVVAPLGGERTLASAARVIREALSPPIPIAGDGVARSFVSLDAPPAVELSALRAGPGGALVVRLANRWRDPSRATVRFSRAVAAARAVDLREGDLALGNTGLDVLRTAAPPEVIDGALAVRLAPFEIGSWVVELR